MKPNIGVSIIAIDGPVAAGKTTVSRRLALRLGFKYLDTGVMYRAVTWLASHCGIPIDDEAALGVLAEQNTVSLAGLDGDHVSIRGHLLGPELRQAQVNAQVSFVSRIPAVRRALVHQQQQIAAQGDILLVGRDIGTVVLPDADLKIFLTASSASRARRRWKEMREQGSTVELQQVLQETKNRDDIDSHRADSPLMPAQDAFILDTEDLGVDQVVECILERIHQFSNKTKL